MSFESGKKYQLTFTNGQTGIYTVLMNDGPWCFPIDNGDGHWLSKKEVSEMKEKAKESGGLVEMITLINEAGESCLIAENLISKAEHVKTVI